VHSEDFVGRIARRVGRVVKGVVKREIRLAGRVARGAIGIDRFIVTGPLRIVVRRFMHWIRDNIARLFRSLVARVIQRLPPPVRPYNFRAVKSIGIGEYESFASETDIRSAEMLIELETESSVEYESLAGGGISPEVESETESYSTEHEMEDELETSSSGENQVAELLTEFDTELFNFAESELRQALQSELSQPYTPGASQPYILQKSWHFQMEE
jgi:hypothetical protein